MELFEIGRVIRPHGLGGRMKVLSYLEAQGVLSELCQVYVGWEIRETTAFELDSLQTGSGSFFLKLKGIEDRNVATTMVGMTVWMPAMKMKALPDGEYYWSEIIGLEAVTEEGQALGTIESVFPTGSNDVYVCRNGRREILLPATDDVVKKIDTERRIMIVRLLRGLAEL
jgi:16S rRNA processing protein RimM